MSYCIQAISDLCRITEVLNVNNIFPSKFLYIVPNPSGQHRPEAEFLDKIQTNLESFPPPYSQIPLTALHEMSISSNSRNFLQFLLVRSPPPSVRSPPPPVRFPPPFSMVPSPASTVPYPVSTVPSPVSTVPSPARTTSLLLG